CHDEGRSSVGKPSKFHEAQLVGVGPGFLRMFVPKTPYIEIITNQSRDPQTDKQVISAGGASRAAVALRNAYFPAQPALGPPALRVSPVRCIIYSA
ncbi:hypothetical protein EVAR_36822_1, partial [Eumeta japonica]